MKLRRPIPDPWLLAALVLLGCFLEAVLLRWWVPAFSLSAHPGFYPSADDPLIWLLGSGPPATHHLVALFAALALPYPAGLFLAGRLRGRAALAVAFAGSFLFGATLLLIFPAGARDLFHNIIDGRELWLYGRNPMITVPSALSADPVARFVTAWQQEPAGYGPLWYLLTAPAALLGGSTRNGAIVAFKALPFAFELVALGAIGLLAHRLHPERAAAAVLCFGWNPLVLWEIAGNGHNDIVMMAFVLLALLALFSRRWPLAFPLLACSILVKFVTVILFPLFLLWILKRHGRRALRPLAGSLAAAALLTGALLLPFWAGRATFAGLVLQSNRFIASPALVLLRLVGIRVPDGVMGLILPNSAPVLAVKAALTLTFLLFTFLVLAKLQTTEQGLVDACTTEIVLFLVFVVTWFWPWYAIWALPLAALRPGTALSRLLIMFSFTALFSYVTAISGASTGLFGHLPLQFTEPLLIFLAPAVYALMHVWPPRRLRRRGAHPPAPARADPFGAPAPGIDS